MRFPIGGHSSTWTKILLKRAGSALLFDVFEDGTETLSSPLNVAVHAHQLAELPIRAATTGSATHPAFLP